MEELEKLPEGFERYQYIVDEFMKVPNVEKVGVVKNKEGLSMYLTNNKVGKALKVWNFPLTATIDVDIPGVVPGQSDYDILDLEDPGIMLMAGIKKAELFFK